MARIAAIVIGLLAWLACACPAAPQQPGFTQSVQISINEVLDRAERDGDLAKAESALAERFDQVVTFASPREFETFRASAYSLRLMRQLQGVPADKRVGLLKYLRANDELAKAMAFSISPKNRPADVCALLDRLRQARGDQAAEFANLTAAICLVHDRPFEREVQENRLRSPDALAIFDYFVANEKKLVCPIRTAPPELLFYLVDTTASIDEMNWAMQRFHDQRNVGRLFFDIDYDVDHWQSGAPKRVDKAGYNLPNLLKCGGVCADQGYFAAAVGKSIGVPAAMVRGANAETGHYWCGFFQFAGTRSRWNFDTGRYDAYRGLRGGIIDPQTREEIPDTYVGLLAELFNTSTESRQNGRALADAAFRVMELDKAGRGLRRDPPAAAPDAWPGRFVGISAELELIELAVRQSPGDRYCWEPLRQLAADGKLSIATKRYWSDALNQVCGTRYPDFVLAMLTPMVKTVDELPEQERLWDWVYGIVKDRSDLAAQARMEQAALCEKAGQLDRAAEYYRQIIENYANSGPFVIDALAKAEKNLRDLKQPEKALKLYEQTWSRIRRPREMAGPFVTQSNWYRVGQILAAKLDEAGQKQKAQAIRAQIAGAGREE